MQNTKLCCILLYYIVLRCVVLYCTTLHGTALYCIVLHCTVLYCTVLYCIALYCIVQYWIDCIILYCLFIIVVHILPAYLFINIFSLWELICNFSPFTLQYAIKLYAITSQIMNKKCSLRSLIIWHCYYGYISVTNNFNKQKWIWINFTNTLYWFNWYMH